MKSIYGDCFDKAFEHPSKDPTMTTNPATFMFDRKSVTEAPSTARQLGSFHILILTLPVFSASMNIKKILTSILP